MAALFEPVTQGRMTFDPADMSALNLRLLILLMISLCTFFWFFSGSRVPHGKRRFFFFFFLTIMIVTDCTLMLINISHK